MKAHHQPTQSAKNSRWRFSSGRTDDPDTHPDPGDSDQRPREVKPLEILVPLTICLFICLAFVSSSPLFGVYLFVLTALTLGPAFILRTRGWGFSSLFLATPALLYSLDTFAFRLGWFNIPEYTEGSWPAGLQQDSIFTAAVLSVLANAAFWVGYFLPLSRGLAARLLSRIRTPLEDDEPQPREWRVWVVFLAGIATRVLLVKQGVGGYFSDPTARTESTPYIQFLLLVEGLTVLALILYFCTLLRGRGFSWGRFSIMFGIEMASVLLLGFKGQVIYRFLYLAIAFVLIKRRLPWWILLAGIGSLVMIFPINLAARSAFGSGQIQTGNLGSIQQGYVSSTQQVFSGTSIVDLLSQSSQQIVHNSADLEVFSMVLQYIDQSGDRQNGVEYLYPIYSFIPRALWASKPVATYGGWVYHNVYGQQGNVSIGQSVPGDFYLNFGWIGVIVGFLLFGTLQRILLPIIRETTSLRYLPLAPLLVIDLVFVNSDVGASLSGTLRTLLFSALVLRLAVPHPVREPTMDDAFARHTRAAKERQERAPGSRPTAGRILGGRRI